MAFQNRKYILLYAYCSVSNTLIRGAANHRSGIVSQLLFGEIVGIIEDRGDFYGCEFTELGVFGYIDKRHLMALPFRPEKGAYTLEPMYFTSTDSGSLLIPMGSFLHEFDGIQFKKNQKYFHFGGLVIDIDKPIKDVSLFLKIAKKYLNAPYLSGGRSPFGIDSFGLVHQLLKFAGCIVQNDSDNLVQRGEIIHFLESAQPGDIVYFDSFQKNFGSHFGILLGDGMVLHSFDKVRIDYVDHFGIYNPDLKLYTHKLRSVFRFFETIPDMTDVSIPQKIKEQDIAYQTTLL